jgi:hypothetical protein
MTGPQPTTGIDPLEHAWSREADVINPALDYPDTGTQPATADHRPWSHTIGVTAAIAAIAAAIIAVATTTLTGHPTSAPAAAPATSTTTDTATDTATVTTTAPPTTAAYLPPMFDPDQITPAERQTFYADLDQRQVTTSRTVACGAAVQGCLDLSATSRSGDAITAALLEHEEDMMPIDRTDAAQIMGAAVRDFPGCY